MSLVDYMARTNMLIHNGKKLLMRKKQTENDQARTSHNPAIDIPVSKITTV